MKELKPCPFCGGEAKVFKDTLVYTSVPNGAQYIIWCTKCGCRSPMNIENKEEAIEKWNKRHTWNNGRPTEDGEYLVLWKDTDTGQNEYSVLLWHSMINSWYDTEMGELWHDEYHAEVIAWQKIEPLGLPVLDTL